MKRLLLAGMTMLCLNTLPAMSQTRTVQLKIIETSDVHGHFFPYDFIERRALKGSLCRVNTYVERLRKEYGDRLLLIDNGDILQGQPCTYWSNYVNTAEENLAAQVVNYMHYDVQAVGNHDVETSHRVYDKWISEVRCPMVGANIISRETGLPYVHPYTIIERELTDGATTPGQDRRKVKIAIIGLLTPTIACWLNESMWQGMDFEEMVQSARRWVKHVQQVERPDLIIGLFHSGFNGGITMEGADGQLVEEDATERIAKEVEGFDAIFFGHDHIARNVTLKSPTGRDVPCLDPSCWALSVAEATIELTYDGSRLVSKAVKGEIVDVRDEAIDEQMMSYFQPQIDRIKAYVDRRIGIFAAGCSTRDSYFGNSAFTDFLHDMQLRISGADISFNAPLSFDSRIEKGPVTVADMFKLYRFENQLYIVKMTGREIRGFLEMSYDLWANTMTGPDDHLLLLNDESTADQQRMGFRNYTFNFDSASGIDYEVDVTRPDGQKVNILRMSNGEPFDEDRMYTVVMNSYRANGGGDLMIRGAGIPKDSLEKRIVYQSELDLRHYLMEEIERMGTVHPKAASNWKFVPEKWTRPAARRDRRLLFGN